VINKQAVFVFDKIDQLFVYCHGYGRASLASAHPARLLGTHGIYIGCAMYHDAPGKRLIVDPFLQTLQA
jgi:hypothetical protein